MDDSKIYVGYHATDKSNAISIIHENFRISNNIKHWLGFGVYFFLDRELAKWWATNPTLKFGCKINSSVIIKSQIKVNTNQVCDLRDLKTYNEIIGLYKIFISEVKNGRISPIFADSLSTKAETLKEINKNRDILECLFFNWLVNNYDIKIIIACFIKRETTAYLNQYPKDYLYKLRIKFPEIQVCVTDTNIIIHNETENASYV